MAEVVRIASPGGPQQLQQATVELPAPGAGEIRLRQTAIGVNFIDVYHRRGLYPLPGGIPGVEAVGVVTAVGDDVVDLKPGDRVAYAGAPVGAYVSERNLPAWRAVALPADLGDAAVASTFMKGITAHMLLTRVFAVGPGVTVLIHSAAGGLGQLMVRWASHLGATVIATVGSEQKAAIARNAGAHHVIVGRDADFAGAVAALTEARGVDVAYDGVGGATLAKTMACVRPFGLVASLGDSGGAIPLIDINDIGPRRSLSLARPSVMAHMQNADAYRRSADAVLAAMAQGILQPAGQAYRLSDAHVAHTDLEAGRTSGSLYLVP